MPVLRAASTLLCLLVATGCFICPNEGPGAPSDRGVYGQFASASDVAITCPSMMAGVKVCAAGPSTGQHPDYLEETKLHCTSSNGQGNYSLSLPEGRFRLCASHDPSGSGDSWQCDPCTVDIGFLSKVRRDGSRSYRFSWSDGTGATGCEDWPYY